jgi:hypothetical protein
VSKKSLERITGNGYTARPQLPAVTISAGFSFSATVWPKQDQTSA